MRVSGSSGTGIDMITESAMDIDLGGKLIWAGKKIAITVVIMSHLRQPSPVSFQTCNSTISRDYLHNVRCSVIFPTPALWVGNAGVGIVRCGY